MDFVFLPYQAVMLMVALLGGTIGAFWLRKKSKLSGFFLGVAVVVLLTTVLKLISPVKLTTNTAQYNKQQNEVIMKRHSQPLPPRVVVERLSYEEELKLKNKALRSRGENK